MKYTKSIFIIVIFILGMVPLQSSASSNMSAEPVPIIPDLYIPVSGGALNIKEEMTLTPIFTPDNAESTYVGWIEQATSTIEIQNQYIKLYADFTDWQTSPTPLVKALVDAAARGVQIRVQVREDSDSDNIAGFLDPKTNIEVRGMGNSVTDAVVNHPNGYLSATHNKLMIIDHEVILISSINFGSAFENSREAGMVIQNVNAANHFLDFFEIDWASGEDLTPTAASPLVNSNTADLETSISTNAVDYPSHTNIPKTNFTGTYNITLFTNPDNADEVIFNYLKSAKESIYVSMYTISRPDFNNTLIELKKANPALDIQVLISHRRVGASENVDTWSAVKSLVANAIPVYNSSVEFFANQAGFYHNKYWIIDGKDTFIYSGNWSPKSVTEQLPTGDPDYASGDPNRDMGVAVHDATDIAAFYKDVWDKDVAIADAWELPIGINQNSFEDTDVISGTVELKGVINGFEATSVSYRINSGAYTDVTVTGGVFSVDFDTTTIENGITTFEFKAEGTQTFTDKVTVNVVNLGKDDNWRVLITEVLPNPDVVSDTDGEFFELTNSFPFAVYIGAWQVGDAGELYTFSDNYEIPAYTSLIFARNSAGFKTGYSVTADFEIGISLVNGGDYIQFIDHKGDYVDVVAYGDETAPDGSETIAEPGAEESISRVNLHIDTNKATDFELTTPSPKADVPHVEMGALPESNVGIEPYPFLWALVAIPVVSGRKRR